MLTLIKQRSVYYSMIIVLFSLFIKLAGMHWLDLLVEEAYYWNYSTHLNFGYLDHPPMVGVLIRLSTTLLGNHEFAVRLPALLCWCVSAFFSFKLTQLIKPSAAPFAVMLLAILPFFFIQSIIMTPDMPLIAAWSASLYYLYRACVLNQSNAWYKAGIWLGLGLLSKYTIVLLGLATLIYLVITPKARLWFVRKESYLSALLAVCLFTPVLYWNATHEWVSFAFQGTRRLLAPASFSFHELVGLFLVFLTPLGVLGFIKLFQRANAQEEDYLTQPTHRFITVFTLTPLVIFSLFSLTHPIKFNWIGPGMLSLVPWLAVLISNNKRLYRGWVITAITLLIIYSAMLGCIISGTPKPIYQALFTKFIDWRELTQKLHDVSDQIELTSHQTPQIVPLDLYNLASEFSFYQSMAPHPYKVIGRHVFGQEDLMFKYWSDKAAPKDQILILIAESPKSFDAPEITSRVVDLSRLKTLWSFSQGARVNVRRYYYKIVRVAGN
jgi:4-amino-4-deoxy-L-arabinose transferase-like glycosyltransferase